MITHPGPVEKKADTALLRRTGLDIICEPDEPEPESKIGKILVRKGLREVDYDAIIDETFQIINSRIVNLDAKLLEGTPGKRQVKHYRSLREFAASPIFKRRLREAYKTDQLKEWGERVKDVALSEHGGDFNYGLYPDERGANSKQMIQVENIVLPTLGSSTSKQMLFVDYLDMHRKSFQAATHNPIGKKICRIIPQFVLGRSLLVTLRDEDYQKVFDTYWKMNKMRIRIKTLFRELLIYGEIFLRYFRQSAGLVVRSIDPSTIWDIVTNPEDIEDVYYYHQQYLIPNRIPIPGMQSPPTTLVIRQIPASEIDHFKINATSMEKRGRSELFTILGYLVRLKEFVNDRILLNKIRSMFAVDVSVKGQQKEVTEAEQQFTTPPGTGSVMIHNDSVEIEFKNPKYGEVAAATGDAELLLKMIAMGCGISESFLGAGQSSTRAGALIQTEPDIKNFEDYQELIEVIVEAMGDRVFTDARLRSGLKEQPKQLVISVAFPSIAQEDRSSKMKDIGFAESMQWFSKRRAANMAADEMKQDDYDFDEEQSEIREELASDPLIASEMAQTHKGEDPGVQKTEKQGEVKALTNPGAQMRSDPSDRALPKKDINLRAGGLDRGKEKKRIAFGTKREAAETPVLTRQGWSPEARAAAIVSRKRKLEQRRLRAEQFRQEVASEPQQT